MSATPHGPSRLRLFAGKVKRRLLRMARAAGSRLKRSSRFAFVLGEQWAAFHHEVRAHGTSIRALEERCRALSARATALQREIEPLRIAVEPSMQQQSDTERALKEASSEVRR